MRDLPDAALAQVAGFFQMLAEPSRLRVLNLLREQPQCVGDLARACSSSAANISRHLAQLQRHGLVHREGRGTSVYYRIADPSVYVLCDLVCGQLARQHARIAELQARFLKP
ncbi:ArsR/SmtB family transcription factor [Roseateles sp. DB2]|uniref:ArsR/SmtB family transcription factor n=1 Tax=Roseateles sp. DB2 TaxID=3453717 RepID=UPI003EEA3832